MRARRLLAGTCTGSGAAAGTQPETSTLSVTVPAGIDDGQTGRGDHVLQNSVEIPKKLTAGQEELVRELAAEMGESVKEKRGLFGRKK